VAAKRIVRREAAVRDAETAIDHYAAEGGSAVAAAFADALVDALDAIARQPGMGSPRYAELLDVRGLRTWPLTRFPYLVFYFERSEAIEVWRVLHGSRDIPASLADHDAGP